MTRTPNQPMHARSIRAAFAAVVVGLSGGVASAQNALGDGRGLDNNLGQGGRLNYQRPSFAQELQFRNAIVTGNAPGGLSFRGDLGYRAAGEFSGSLGSDSLFSFQRDSLYSGLAGMGIRGTDALQYQFSLTTGARPPQDLVGDLTYTRDAAYQTSAAYTGQSPLGTGAIRVDPTQAGDVRGLNLYQPSAQEGELRDALTGTLRSSSSYSTTTNLTPVVLQVFERGIERQPYGLTSSPLTGVTASPMRTRDEASPAPGTPRDPIAERARTAYQEVIDRLRERAESQAARSGDMSEAGMDSVAARLEAIRREMLGIPQAQPGTQTDATSQPGTQPPSDEDAAPADPLTDPSIDPLTGQPRVIPGQQNPAESEGEADPRAGRSGVRPAPTREDYQIDERTLELIRASERPITTLVDPGAETRDLYTEHMRTGERLIASERYFDAEERFARALAINPGDPSAQIGRIHAQLGAGLVLSASVNLRTLMMSNPELIGVKYAGTLLPAPERVDLLIDSLRNRAGLLKVAGEGEEDVSVRRSAALLLAYLGYQNQRPEIIREGLDAYESFGAEDDRRFANIVRQVWLEGETPGAREEAP